MNNQLESTLSAAQHSANTPEIFTVTCNKGHIFKLACGSILHCVKCNSDKKDTKVDLKHDTKIVTNNTASTVSGLVQEVMDIKSVIAHHNTRVVGESKHSKCGIKFIVGYISILDYGNHLTQKALTMQILSIKEYAQEVNLPIKAIYQDIVKDPRNMGERKMLTDCEAKLVLEDEFVYGDVRRLPWDFIESSRLNRELLERRISLKCLKGGTYSDDSAKLSFMIETMLINHKYDKMIENGESFTDPSY